MTINGTRLALYAIISGIEDDLRAVMLEHLASSQSDPKALLTDPIWDKCIKRLQAEAGEEIDKPSLRDLVYYLDFADAYSVLNANRAHLPHAIGRAIKFATTILDPLVAIRNRVAHNRPLLYDDYSKMLAAARHLKRDEASLWKGLGKTLLRLETEPGFILGLSIPVFPDYREIKHHNLPSADFDETGFIGRKQQLEMIISLINGAYPVITILGDGGIGKTALALKAAYDILDSSNCPFDAVVWSSSKTSAITLQEIRNIDGAIRDSLGLLQNVAAVLGPGKPEDIVSEVLDYLTQFRVLLVLDNLETVLDARLRDFLSRLPAGSKVLITSRIGLGAYEHPVKLEPLTDNEASDLLRALATTRSVGVLKGISSKKRRDFCKKLQNNPGFIKWFVSVVQAGKRPEEALQNTSKFLEFCMSNVYEYVSEDGRTLLRIMQAIPGAYTQPELEYLSDIKDIDRLQIAIQQLVTTNMCEMRSMATGDALTTKYEISDLARAYLAKFHPPSQKEFQLLQAKKRGLLAIDEQARAAALENRFDIHTIFIRDRSHVLIAKYLRDAITSIHERKFEEGEKLIEKAKGLAPEYFEVHRTEAFLRIEMGDLLSADSCYQAAIECEKALAPLRLWYGGFLAQILGDLDRSLEQLKIGLALEPESVELQFRVAQVQLYRREYAQCDVVLKVLEQDQKMVVTMKRKVRDLRMQYFLRTLEGAVHKRDWADAVENAENLVRSYANCPAELKDNRMLKSIYKSFPLIRTCLRNAHGDLIGKVRATSLLAIATGGESGVIVKKSEYDGQIEAKSGRLVEFSQTSMADRDDWGKMSVGAPVYFAAYAPDSRMVANIVILK